MSRNRIAILVLIGALVITLGAVALALLILPFKDMRPYTAGNEASDRVGIIAFGDQGTANFRQRRVAALMESVCRSMPQLDFIQTLGDNFYFDGVTSVDDPLWRDSFEDIYDTPCLRSKSFHALLGNHDYGGNPDAQIAYSQTHLGTNRWNMPGRFYPTQVGEVDGKPLVTMVVLDTNTSLDEQIALIDFTFGNAADSIWRVVAGHHNVRTDSVNYHDDADLRNALLPALLRNHVHLYLSGHSHNLQLIEVPGEPLYVVAGGGGRPPRELIAEPKDKPLLALQALGFASLLFDRSSATIQYTATDGGFFTDFSSARYTFQVQRACLENTAAGHCVVKVPETGISD